MKNELYHYGVKGMRWGIRRYQDKSGHLTSEGKNRVRAARVGKTKKDVDDIISTLSKKEKDMLALSKDEEYLSYKQGSSVARRILIKDGNTPVSFFDILDDGDSFNLVMATRSEEKYRGKRYASKAAMRGIKWYESNKSRFDNKPMVWGVREDNEASIKIAKRLGFEYEKGSRDKDSDGHYWVNYRKD